jgi:ABC-type sugar transport system substrate-binding protein
MRRREFIALVAAVIPSARLLRPAHAQTSGIRRIGVIYQGGLYEVSIEGLREGLKAAGLEEGQHVTLLVRNVRGDVAAAEAAARALERDEKVDVIVTINTTTTRAAKRATTEVPIVFSAGTDPVAAGLREHGKAWRTADRLSFLGRRSHGETARNPARDGAEAAPHRRLLRSAHSGRRHELCGDPRGSREAGH